MESIKTINDWMARLRLTVKADTKGRGRLCPRQPAMASDRAA